MVRRCERKNGLHPLELLNYLMTMRSGVKNQGEAVFIAEEYADALRNEMEKARRMELPYPTITADMSITYSGIMSNPSVQRIIQKFPYGVYDEQRPATTTPQLPQPPRPYQPPTAPQQPSQGGGESVLASIVAELVRNRGSDNQLILNLFQQIQQLHLQQQEMQMSQMREIIKELSEGMKSLGESFTKAISELKETMSKPQPDPELIYKASKAEAKVEFYEKMLETERKYVEKLEKHLDELAKRPSEGYESDTARLTAEALNRLTSLGDKLIDVLDKRQPVKIILEGLPKVMEKLPPEKETETSTEALEELEKLGLVEEAGEE